MRMGEEELTKRVYNSEIDGTCVRGSPPVRWINRVEEYCRDRNEWSEWVAECKRGLPGQGEMEEFLLWLSPGGEFPGGSEASKIQIDRQQRWADTALQADTDTDTQFFLSPCNFYANDLKFYM